MRLGETYSNTLTKAKEAIQKSTSLVENTPAIKFIKNTTEELANQIKFFKSSTDDFPALNASLNNKTREYLEAHRFYNLEPSDTQLREKSKALLLQDSNLIAAKYPLNHNANNEYSFPISLFEGLVQTRPFFRESERAHDINLTKEIKSHINEDKKKLIAIKTKVNDYVKSTIKDDTFPERYIRSYAKQRIVRKFLTEFLTIPHFC